MEQLVCFVATLARVWVSHVLANVATCHFKVGGPLSANWWLIWEWLGVTRLWDNGDHGDDDLLCSGLQKCPSAFVGCSACGEDVINEQDCFALNPAAAEKPHREGTA